MDYARKRQQQSQQLGCATAPLPAQEAVPPLDLALKQARAREDALAAFTLTPVSAQRQAAQPMLDAAGLERQEHDALDVQRASLQRALASFDHLPPDALHTAVQRRAAQSTPAPPARPQSAAEWVTVMRAKAAQVEGRKLDARGLAEFTGLQRQVAQTLSTRFRQDRQSADARYAEYATHLVALQRTPLSAPVARVVLGLIPQSERAALQRAVDAQHQRAALEHEQDEQAFLQADLQRQAAEVEQQAGQPVYERIQARRGHGAPLPEDVRRHLEAGLNSDLSRVRVHTDSEADTLALSVHALAFTSGQDIFFRAGTYEPNTSSGLELLAHEVTHTVQQARGRVGRGVDPDARLEEEARQSGAKLASMPIGAQFGTRAATAQRPGAADHAAAPAVQRWANPLVSLRQAAAQAYHAASSTVHNIGQRAHQAITGAVNKATKLAAPALKVVQAGVDSVSAQAHQATAALGQAVQTARARTAQLGHGALQLLQHSLDQAKSAAGQVKQTLASKAQQFSQYAGDAAGKLGERIKRGAGSLYSAGKHLAVQAKQQLATAAAPVLDKLAQKGRALQQLAAAKIADAKAGLKGAYDHAQAFMALSPDARRKVVMQQVHAAQQKLAAGFKTGVQTMKTGLGTAASWTKKTAQQGWNAAMRTKDQLVAAVNKVRANPKFQSMVSKLKAAGIVVAKVGTAIVVGSVVIAGAAALTAATGGLAGPALVAALFASGSLSGAAAEVVGNALTGQKWNRNITAKSMVVDGALGVVAGPAAKLLGGVTKAVTKPVARFVGQKVLMPAARKFGQSVVQPLARRLGQAAVQVAPRLSARAAQRVISMKASAQVLLGQVSRLQTFITDKAAALGRSTAPARATAKTWWNTSAAGRALGRLDGAASSGLRRLGKLPQVAGEALAPGWTKGATWLRNSSGVRAGRGLMANLSNRISVGGFRVRNAVNGGWQGVRRSALRSERDLRFYLDAKGVGVNLNQSITGKLFDTAERSMVSMKTYVAAEAKSISAEVRKSWYGSAGVGGVLRKGKTMEQLVSRTPSLKPVWDAEQRRARQALIKAAMNSMSNEARAAGTPVSRATLLSMAQSRVTADAVSEYALRHARGPLITQATAAYRAESAVAQTGFDASQNWFGQLPRVYAAGLRQQGQSLRDKVEALRTAGSVSGAVAVAGGWFGEKSFKTVLDGAASSYKKSADWRMDPAKLRQAGMDKWRSDLGTTIRSAATGLSSQAPFGQYALLTPFSQAVKTISERAGTAVVTEKYQLKPLDDANAAPAPEPDATTAVVTEKHQSKPLDDANAAPAPKPDAKPPGAHP